MKEGRESFIIKSSFYILLYLNGNQLVITKGYKARVTTIEGQNAFAPTLCFAQVSRDSQSKHAWSDHEW